MKKLFLFCFIAIVLSPAAKSQVALPQYDSVQFGKNLNLANQLVEYEYIQQFSLDHLKQEQDVSTMEWFSFPEGNKWHTVGGTCADGVYSISRHVLIDSAYAVTNYTGNYDTSGLSASGCALTKANSLFQLIRDTIPLYFNSFLVTNPDKTISIWFLPAFQPSGQAIYGCEWEYVFDNTGLKLLTTNSHTAFMTGVWIGQPREVWLNYRNTNHPTVGSLFFALSFRDYFTRLRIDTRKSTSTTTKNSQGTYTWSHSVK